MRAHVWSLLLLGLCLTSSAAVDPEPGKTPRVGLDQYRPHGQETQIPGVAKNASGLAYSTKTKSLFVVIDSPPGIVEFEPGGSEKRTIRLKGFVDPEGITHVAGDSFAIVDEYMGSINLCRIEAETSVVLRKHCDEIVVGHGGSNEGFEGITYDAGSKHFFVVKEKEPRMIYRVARDGQTSALWDAETTCLGLLDLSDVFFDSETGHLILLSHESKMAVECTTGGNEVSRLSLTMEKAEGLTLDANRRLYVCGEPNSLQEYETKAE